MRLNFGKYWVAIVGIVVVVAILLASLLLPEMVERHRRLEALITIAGWLLLVLQQVYNHSEKFYLFINRLRLVMTREVTRWNFTVDLGLLDPREGLDSALATIRSLQLPKTRVWIDESDRKVINMEGYTLLIFVARPAYEVPEEVAGSESLVIQLSNLELPYSRYKDKVEGEVFTLIEAIVNKLRPSTQKYSVKIGFQSPNPYFGFFVRRLELPKVVAFQCDVFETVGGKEETVQITRDEIRVTTDSLHAARFLSSRYIALSSPQ